MSDKAFEAGRHLRSFRGKDYLEVKWRVVWLRSEHPGAVIDTELVEHSAATPTESAGAIFKARVATPGGGEATGWGSQTASDFPDYIEKAETKALGRALAALGFGTQFCEDFSDQGASPERGSTPPQQGVEAQPSQRRMVRNPGSDRASEPQVRAIFALGKDLLALESEALEHWISERFGHRSRDLTRTEASGLITEMKASRKAA
ncbi:MAG: hypothetical protein GEU28_09605 [Dehalococcoidia bacterium]|nr:hypothetical protein [Dehalococcoidia bacterium]